MQAKRFIEQHFTVLNGWVSAGILHNDNDGYYPASYDTREEAIDAIRGFFAKIQRQIDAGEREAEDVYALEEFRILDSVTGELIDFEVSRDGEIVPVRIPYAC